MNNNFKFLVKQGLKTCVSRYIMSFLLGAIFLLISMKVSGPAQNVILNICGGLFSLPIVFLSSDVYHIIHTRKQREMVTAQLNNKIEAIFVSFVFMANKLRKNFNGAIEGDPEFLEGKRSSSQEIFNEISSTKHNGFFIFSYFDNFCTAINEMLESPLFLSYVPSNIISLISEFSLRYQQLQDEFKIISKDDFIQVSSEESLEFAISEDAQSSYDTYNIFRNLDGKRHCIYIANYPIFDETMLKGLYRISGTKAKILADQLFQLYALINKWELISQNQLNIDSIMILSGRLCQKTYINFYLEENIAFNIQWF